MPALKLMSFAGEVPRMSPRLLPDGYAQRAVNCRMLRGILEPLREPKEIGRAKDARAMTIYQYGNEWLSWNSPVSVTEAPVDSTPARIYYTGDEFPKYREGEAVYRLGVPAPTTKPTVALAGEATDKAVPLQTRIYVYTYVTEIGEESAPSPVSDFIEWGDGMTTTLSGLVAPPAGRRITKIRIYRSQSSSGATKMQFAVELPASTTEWVDTVPATRLAEVLPSQGWGEPPEKLQGLTSMPGGVMAGFVGKTLWFCEPFTPYAWPESYSLACDYEIVALCAIGTMLVVATTGNPYVVQGTDPLSYSMEKLEVNLPCVSARSMVDMGYAAMYASHDGLVTVSSGGAAVMTESLYTPEQWRRLSPHTMQSGENSGYYIAAYETLSAEGEERRGMLMVRPSGDQPYVTTARLTARSFFTDIKSGNLYFNDDAGAIMQFDPADRPYTSFEWRSKVFVSPAPVNLGAGRVDAAQEYTEEERAAINKDIAEKQQHNVALFNAGDMRGALGSNVLHERTVNGSVMLDISGVMIGDQYTTLRLYGDGKPVAEVTKSNKTFRLPAGRKFREFEIELSGNGRVFEVLLAATGAALASA